VFPGGSAGAAHAALLERLGSWPGPISVFDELPSTSEWLKGCKPEERPAWTVVWALEQHQGRGRLGRVWSSPRGNLYLSVALPVPVTDRPGLLALGAGVVVCDAVQRWAPAVRLKWPNDLVVGDRKLGGLLLQATASGAGLDALLLGVGLNVERAPELSPEALPAVALCQLGATPALDELAAAVLAGLRLWYHAGPLESRALRGAWHARAVDWWGQTVTCESPEGALVGRCLEVDEDGALVLELEGGTHHRCLSGDVRRLRRLGEPDVRA